MAKTSICTRNAIVIACTIFLSSCGVHITPQVRGNTQIKITQEGDTIYLADKEDQFVEDQEPESIRSKVAATYTAEIGVRERTGRNDGKDVEKYLASDGIGKGNAWCAAFVHWVFEVCGIITPITAWSPTAENKKKIRYKNGKTFGPGPQRADVITLYYESKGRIGHTGFFDHMINSSMEASVEGNTNGEHSSEGDGVYLVFRPLKTINSISSWLD